MDLWIEPEELYHKLGSRQASKIAQLGFVWYAKSNLLIEREKMNASILIVDDTHANLRFLAEMLTRVGYVARPVASGAMALNSVQTELPDLILLDIMMPEMSGYEVCKQLKADPTTRDIPVIFISALSEISDKVMAFKVGGVDYITKPFQTEEILARIETHLTLRHLQQRLQERNERLVEEIAVRKNAEAVLRQRTLELEDRNAELDAFAHTVAHDLKNPLGLIGGYADLLVAEYDILKLEELHQIAEGIAKGTHKMVNIINSLLLLASARKMEIAFQALDMAAVTSEALERLEKLAETRHAEITGPDQWPVALGYAPWVEEVWVNYISNAIKYGGEPPYVELGAAQFDGPIPYVRFWVRDNGPGLTEQEREKLFAPFTRLHTMRAKGHGLGLSIVHDIVERLGGEVGIESQVGQGSTFFFTLPLATQDQDGISRLRSEK
jgi:signal transduction histidine kinase